MCLNGHKTHNCAVHVCSKRRRFISVQLSSQISSSASLLQFQSREDVRKPTPRLQARIERRGKHLTADPRSAAYGEVKKTTARRIRDIGRNVKTFTVRTSLGGKWNCKGGAKESNLCPPASGILLLSTCSSLYLLLILLLLLLHFSVNVRARYTDTHRHTRARAYTRAHTRTHAHTHIHARTQARIHTHTHTRARTHTHTYTHARTHTHTRTHTYTHIHTTLSLSTCFGLIGQLQVKLVLHCSLHKANATNNNNSVALVNERTIPTERLPLVGEVSAKFCG
jgi:hypothetical protein